MGHGRCRLCCTIPQRLAMRSVPHGGDMVFCGGRLLAGQFFHARSFPCGGLSGGAVWSLPLLKGHRLPSIFHPSRWYMDGTRMAVHQLQPKPSDSEKITINLGYVDLGHIELMVQEGFYSNRTDFIRTAIRNQLERH